MNQEKTKRSIVLYCSLFIAVALMSLTIAQPPHGAITKKEKVQAPKPLNIVLIIADQFRADACKREGFQLNTTPFLDSLAETGTWFNKPIAASRLVLPVQVLCLPGDFQMQRMAFKQKWKGCLLVNEIWLVC